MCVCMHVLGFSSTDDDFFFLPCCYFLFFHFCYSHSFRRYLCNKCVRAKWSAAAVASLFLLCMYLVIFRLSLFVVVKFVMKWPATHTKKAHSSINSGRKIERVRERETVAAGSNAKRIELVRFTLSFKLSTT